MRRLQFCDIVMYCATTPAILLLCHLYWRPRAAGWKGADGENAEHFDSVDNSWAEQEQERPIGEMSSSLFLPDDDCCSTIWGKCHRGASSCLEKGPASNYMYPPIYDNESTATENLHSGLVEGCFYAGFGQWLPSGGWEYGQWSPLSSKVSISRHWVT